MVTIERRRISDCRDRHLSPPTRPVQSGRNGSGSFYGYWKGQSLPLVRARASGSETFEHDDTQDQPESSAIRREWALGSDGADSGNHTERAASSSARGKQAAIFSDSTGTANPISNPSTSNAIDYESKARRRPSHTSQSTMTSDAPIPLSRASANRPRYPPLPKWMEKLPGQRSVGREVREQHAVAALIKGNARKTREPESTRDIVQVSARISNVVDHDAL